MITETARTVLHTIPAGQWQRPPVQEFRQVLANTAPSRPASH
ncbi:hypothetical protein ACFQ07_30975 [Actinomadura adrarensis]|uniref:Uncharacterized protein n=1 Tax=Actinomadura adrarensis TaxID=1819600 RepID=A0ABW3CT96_9ACTN